MSAIGGTSTARAMATLAESEKTKKKKKLWERLRHL
jgi:hypothetical protein